MSKFTPTQKPDSYQTNMAPAANASCAGTTCPFFGKCGPQAAENLKDVVGQTGGFGGDANVIANNAGVTQKNSLSTLGIQ